jgi:hypothetical protein
MGTVLTVTFGLCIWIILWALGVSGFDGILVVAGLFLIAISLRNVVPHLPGRRVR